MRRYRGDMGPHIEADFENAKQFQLAIGETPFDVLPHIRLREASIAWHGRRFRHDDILIAGGR